MKYILLSLFLIGCSDESYSPKTKETIVKVAKVFCQSSGSTVGLIEFGDVGNGKTCRISCKNDTWVRFSKGDYVMGVLIEWGSLFNLE